MNSVILTVGLNHTTAPVAVRERIAAAPCTRDEARTNLLAQLNSPLFAERLILSTCNRTEIYAVTSERARGEECLRAMLAAHLSVASADQDYLYAYADREAVTHLFAVASGIDSMVIGEFEILGQVREAYQAAAQQRSLGPILHQLFQQAVSVGKRARSETPIGAGATSVAYAAVALARKQLGNLAGRPALVIGAGEMGRRAAKNLLDDGACTVMVASRTFARATDLARQIGCAAIPFEQLDAALAKADLVISATTAPHIILDVIRVAGAMKARGGQPLCLIDIAVPRDIDPQVGALENVKLYNIDDLQELVARHYAAREKAIAPVRAIIAEEVESFWQWYLSRQAAPLLAALHARAEAIRRAEFDKALRRLGHLNLSERDRNVIAALSSSVVSKLLAAPTTQLKTHLQNGDGQLYLEVLRELFELESLEQPQ